MWKEPNTLFFLPTLFAEIAGLRYIHVVRNGLAMATSANDYQLDQLELPVRPRTGREGRRRAAADLLGPGEPGGGRSARATVPRRCSSSHERTVTDPAAVAAEISSFLGVAPTERTRETIAEARAPSDFGRTFAVPGEALSSAELADVERALGRFGYGGIHDGR